MRILILTVLFLTISSCSTLNSPSPLGLEAELAYFSEYTENRDKKNYEKAMSSLHKLLEYFPDDYSYHIIAIIFYNSYMQDDEKALKLVEKALPLAKTKLEISKLQSIKYSILKDYQTALIHQKVVVEEDPSDLQEVMGLAITHLQSENYNESIIYFDKVLKIDSNYAFLNEGFGRAYIGLEKGELALPYLKKAIEEEPKNADLYALLGKAAFLIEDYNGALEYYKLVLSLDPNYSSINQYIGRVYLDFGNAKEALNYFEKAIQKSDSEEAMLYFLAGRAASVMGDDIIALSYYEKAVLGSDINRPVATEKL